MDLLLGRVDQHHPLHSWLTSYGMSELDLVWFRQNPQAPDVASVKAYHRNVARSSSLMRSHTASSLWIRARNSIWLPSCVS